MATGKNIKVLKAGITFGNHTYQAGDFLREAHVTPQVREYADGKLLLGERVLEYTDDEEPTPPEAPAPKEPETPHLPMREALALQNALGGSSDGFQKLQDAHGITTEQLAEAGAEVSQRGNVKLQTPEQVEKAGAALQSLVSKAVETPFTPDMVAEAAKSQEGLTQAAPVDLVKANQAATEAAEPVSEEAAPKAEADEAKADATLEKAILKAVREGHSKGEVVKQVAEGEPYSQRQVGAEFDRLVDAGRIVAGEDRGKYQVNEG